MSKFVSYLPLVGGFLWVGLLWSGNVVMSIMYFFSYCLHISDSDIYLLIRVFGLYIDFSALR